MNCRSPAAVIQLVCMAMGKRRRVRQPKLWVATADLPRSAGCPFYERLNRLLAEAGFDEYAEEVCAEFYAERLGRPGLAPGNYFRMLLVGFFEGHDSERRIAWQMADSLSLRRFLGLGLSERTPDHSTLSKTRRRISLEAHQAVFGWVLERLSAAQLLRGRRLGVDGTTLLANASMRGIVRRDSGEGYQEFLSGLAAASGQATPTAAELRAFDRKRKKKTSNREWTHPVDPEARVAKTKCGRTRMAHKVEHTVDLESGALAAVVVQPADRGDTGTLESSVAAATRNLERAGSEYESPRAVVCDKGYHSNATMVGLRRAGLRSYVSEPARGRRRWQGQRAAQRAVYANRRRIRGANGRRLMRRRAELVERSFAHCYDSGAMRRLHLRGRENIGKRLLIQAAGFNLSLLMRHRHRVGKPRCLQGRLAGRFAPYFAAQTRRHRLHMASWTLLLAVCANRPPIPRSATRRRPTLRRPGASPLRLPKRI